MNQPRLADYAMLIFLGFAFGTSFLAIGVAVREVPPITLAASRCLIAGLCLFALVRVLGHEIPKSLRAWLALALLACTNCVIPFSLLAFGQQRIETSLTSILIATIPLFTLIMAHLFTADRATPRRIVGAVTGFCGIVLLIGPSALTGLGTGVAGQLMIVGAALSFAVTQVLVKRLRAGTPLVNAACSLALAAVGTIIVAAIVETPWQASPGWGSLAILVGLGTACTALPLFVFFYLMGRTGPNFVTMNNYISPAVGVFWGVVLLGENPPWRAYVALAIIFVGVAIATAPGRRRPAPAKPA